MDPGGGGYASGTPAPQRAMRKAQAPWYVALASASRFSGSIFFLSGLVVIAGSKYSMGDVTISGMRGRSPRVKKVATAICGEDVGGCEAVTKPS